MDEVVKSTDSDIDVSIKPVKRVAPKMSNEALDLCANRLLDLLEGDGGKLMREVAEQYKIDTWMQVVGVLQRAIDLGWYSSPATNVTWLASLPVHNSPLFNTNCKECGNDFVRTWPDQLYCSNRCGSIAYKRISQSYNDAASAEQASIRAETTQLTNDAIEGTLGDVVANAGTFDVSAVVADAT